MIGRLRENLIYKLFAILCAIARRWYVMNQLSPQQTRPVAAQVAVRNVPDGYAVVEKDLAVNVTLEGPADQLSRISPDMVVASADLSHSRSGHNLVPVTLGAIQGHDAITVADYEPRAVSVTLEPHRTRRVTLQVQAVGTAAPGYAPGEPEILPGAATASGLADSVDSVAGLVVRPRLAGAQSVVEEDDAVMAIDDHGQDVADVTVSPPTVHVRIPIVEAARERQAFVSATVSGAVAPGYQIRSVTASPDQVTLRGPAGALAAATGVVTQPVDITGASSDVVRQVNCISPAGLVADQGGRVTVTVRVGPIGAGPTAGATSGPAPPTVPAPP
jgi:YbbR domain-containing protein